MVAVANADEQALRDHVLANEFRLEQRSSPIALAVLVTVNIYLGITFQGVSPALLLNGWLVLMGLIFIHWARSLTVFAAREPSDEQILRSWIPRARRGMRIINMCYATSIWVLLPYADLATQYFMVNMYVWYLILQVLATTEASQVAVQAVMVVLGSLVVFLLFDGVPKGIALSCFLILFGIVMIGLRRLIRRSVVAAVDAKRRAEQIGAELHAALEIIKAERDAKSRFIAAASHDLQQPVAAASLFFERALKTEDDMTRSRAIRGARGAFGSVRALLDSMLASLRLEAGMMPARIADTNVAAVIDQVVLEHEAEAQDRHIVLKVRVPEWIVPADAGLLARAIGNLVGNALRHSNGTRVLIAARRTTEGGVGIFALDDGVGIDRDDAERMFEDYAQGSGPHRAFGGFGLGLASARRIAELLGGTLTIDQRWRRGCAFRLTLPGPVTIAAAPQRMAG